MNIGIYLLLLLLASETLSSSCETGRRFLNNFGCSLPSKDNALDLSRSISILNEKLNTYSSEFSHKELEIAQLRLLLAAAMNKLKESNSENLALKSELISAKAALQASEEALKKSKSEIIEKDEKYAKLSSHSNSRDAIYIHLSRKFTNFSLERDEAKLLLKERKEKADYLENQAQKDQQTINYWKDRYQDSAQKLSHLLDALSQETKDSMKWDSFLLRTCIYFIFVISTCGAIFEFSEPLSKLMPWNMYFVFDWPTPMELFAIVINTLLAFDFLMIPPKSSYTFSAISWLINLNSPFIWAFTLIAIILAEIRLFSECYLGRFKRQIARETLEYEIDSKKRAHQIEEQRKKEEKEKSHRQKYQKMKVKYTRLNLEKVLRNNEIETMKEDIQSRDKKSQRMDTQMKQMNNQLSAQQQQIKSLEQRETDAKYCHFEESRLLHQQDEFQASKKEEEEREQHEVQQYLEYENDRMEREEYDQQQINNYVQEQEREMKEQEEAFERERVNREKAQEKMNKLKAERDRDAERRKERDAIIARKNHNRKNYQMRKNGL